MWNEHDLSRRIRAARGLDPNPQTPHPEKEIRTENVFCVWQKEGEGGREAGREGGRKRKEAKEEERERERGRRL
jgi:hypothetical protein